MATGIYIRIQMQSSFLTQKRGVNEGGKGAIFQYFLKKETAFEKAVCFDFYCRNENKILPSKKVRGQVATMAQENQQIGFDSLTRTLSHTHISITECSTK